MAKDEIDAGEALKKLAELKKTLPEDHTRSLNGRFFRDSPSISKENRKPERGPNS